MTDRASARVGRIVPWATWSSRHPARAVVLTVVVTSLGAVCAPTSYAQDASESDSEVTRVELRSDAPLGRTSELEDLIAVEAGQPFDPDAVAQTLRNLQATGVAAEIEAFTTPTPQGLEVTFGVWKAVQVNAVRLEGDHKIRESDLRKHIEQKEGQPLVESRVLRGVYRLQDTHKLNGYFDASVRVRVDVDETSKQADVIYVVLSGSPFTIGRVTFDGETAPFTDEELHARLRAEPGSRYRQQAVQTDAERLERWLVEKGYRLASVGRPQEERDWEERQVHLTYSLSRGPLFKIEVGGADLRELLKNDLLPILGDQRYDEVMLLQSVSRIRTYYQQKGYYKVEVETHENRTDELFELRIRIDPGPTYELGSIGFIGHEEVTYTQLRALMATSPRRLLAPGSGKLIDQVLEDDLDNIRSFYLLQGYAEVQVGPPEVDTEFGQLALTIPIHEGPQRRIVYITFEGVELFEPDRMLKGLPLQQGGPFHVRLLEESLDVIRARYEEKGYESTQIATQLDWNEDNTRVDVHIRVLEGPQSVVDRIIVRGNQRTTTATVRRAMNLETGEPLSAGRLLEVQRRLYDLGVFSRVSVERLPGTPFSSARDVVVRVEEGSHRKVTYGGGFDSEGGVTGIFGYSHANLFGTALSARLDLRASQREQLARILFQQPYLGRYRAPSTYSLFYIREEEESFTSQRRGAQAEIQRFVGHRRDALRFNFRVVEVLDVDPALRPIEIDRDLREVEISSVTPSILWDHRDDPLDPTQGWSTTLQLEYAFPLSVTDEEFLKLFSQQTGYFNLRHFGVLAGSFRLGAIEPLGTTAVLDPTVRADLPSSEVHISERFFAGGRTTHRAYKLDTLGIPGETLLVVQDDPDLPPRFVPVGGNGLLIFNFDWRFPIAGPFGGSLFIDAGNVWADWRDFDIDHIKPGAGVGFRYLSPIGPLRLEVGWKLDREPIEDPYVILFSFGNAF